MKAIEPQIERDFAQFALGVAEHLLHDAQGVETACRRQHEALVDRAKERQRSVFVGALDRSRIVVASNANDDGMRGEDIGAQLALVDADDSGVFARRGFGVELAHDPLFDVGLGDDEFGRRRFETVALEESTGQGRRDQEQHGGVLMRLAVMQHEGLAEVHAVAGRAADQRDIVETGADGGGQGLLATAQAVDQQ